MTRMQNALLFSCPLGFNVTWAGKTLLCACEVDVVEETKARRTSNQLVAVPDVKV